LVLNQQVKLTNKHPEEEMINMAAVTFVINKADALGTN
jgi:hypothetical protein